MSVFKSTLANTNFIIENNDKIISIDPNDFTGDFKSLLTEIQAEEAKLLQGDIAKFAGYKDDGTYDPQNQPLSSDEKLTFLIMFRIPFDTSYKGKDFTSHYGDPLSSSVNSWSKRANDYRAIKGLKKLNEAGQQVQQFSGVWKSVNDLGEDLEEFTNEKGYVFMGENPFNSNIVVPAGLDTPAQEKQKLFDSTSPYNKIPFYFYKLGVLENPYSAVYWLNSKKDKRSRSPHIPSNSSSTIKYRKIIHFTSTLGTVDVTSLNIVKETITNNYYVQVSGIKYYLELAYNLDDEVGFENLDLTGTTVRKENNIYFAEFSKQEFSSQTNSSGVTFGTGIDTGTVFHGIYKITINISIVTTATGNFNLYYGNQKSSDIPYNVSCNDLRSKIIALLNSGINVSSNTKDIVFVKDALQKTTGTPAKIEIWREKKGAYLHKIFDSISDFSADDPNVSLTPQNESTRWSERSSVVDDDWFIFLNVMNHSFSNTPTVNDDDFWLKQNGLTAQEQVNLKKYTKLIFGCNAGRGIAVFINNQDLFTKLEFKSYVQHLRAVYNEFFLTKFYNKKRVISDGITQVSNSSSIEKNILQNTLLKTKPNQAELYIIASWIYNFPLDFVKNVSSLISQINKHDRAGLINLLNGTSCKMDSSRKQQMTDVLNRTQIKNNIYRGL